MPCPSFSAFDITKLLDKAKSLFSDIQDSPYNEESTERQLMEEIATNLDNAKDDYTNSEAKYNAAKKEYIIGHSGPAYYKNMETEEKRKKLERLVQENVDYFLIAMNATEKEINSLKNQINHLNLIKQLFKDNTNIALKDIFGIDISPNALNNLHVEGFETQTEDLNTINRKIYYENHKNERGYLLNTILYIIYYILFLVTVYYLYKNKMNIYTKILIGVFFLLYPYILFFLRILYGIFKIIFQFVV